jgi:uncharacterized protein
MISSGVRRPTPKVAAVQDWTRRSVVGAGFAAVTPLVAPTTWKDVYPFWEVQRGDARVFLMGDGGAVTTPWRSARIETAFAESGVFWKETPEPSPEAIAKLIAAGTNAAHPLSSWLSPRQRHRVAAAAAAVGGTYRQLAAYEPWLAAGALSELYGQRFASAPGPLPVLNAAAATRGKRIRTEFPDVDAMIDFWVGFPAAAQVEQLMFVVDEIDAGPAGDARAAAEWSGGDLSREINRVARESRLYPHKYEAEVAGRNRRWPARFREMIKDGGAAFVFVGADHLFGPEGMLALLETDGMPALRI